MCLLVGSFSTTSQRSTSKRRVRDTTTLLSLVGISSCKGKNIILFFHLILKIKEDKYFIYKTEKNIHGFHKVFITLKEFKLGVP